MLHALYEHGASIQAIREFPGHKHENMTRRPWYWQSGMENLICTWEILKVAHHGSKNSSSEEFLRQVQPVYAIVSAGRGNNESWEILIY